MEFELEDGTVFVRPDRATVDHWLRTLAPWSKNSFAILTMSNGDFLQVALQNSKFIIECRVQDPLHHYRAVKPGGATLFTVDEAIEAVVAFGYEYPNHPDFFAWQNMDSEVGLA